MPTRLIVFLLFFAFQSLFLGQFVPKEISEAEKAKAEQWADTTLNNLSLNEKLGQLFIVALYTNKDEAHINQVRNLVKNEQLGGLILMQDDAERHIELLNEFQGYSKVPMLIGMDAEWGLYQRITSAHKYPWAITLGAIQNKDLIKEMAAQIATDAKRMGVYWDFAPVVDVNTNAQNPIIGNRSFGSSVENVVKSGAAYMEGLQDNGVLAAIKHFPGHGDTSADSHYDLPVVAHSLSRLNEIELAPFRRMMSSGVGGVMVAHLFVPALEKEANLPASLSKSIITGLLKDTWNYKGLIITDALNMGAVAKKYAPGEVDYMALKAGNDIMLFSDGVKEAKELILKGLNNGEITEDRINESVKKILLTKYYLGLTSYSPIDPNGINEALNNKTHKELMLKLYASSLTLLKNKDQLLPLDSEKTYYYLPLEEAPNDTFFSELKNLVNVKKVSAKDAKSLPKNSNILIGLHKDNSTAYKPFTLSKSTLSLLPELGKKHNVVTVLFGSPYGLKNANISDVSTVLVAYENNDDSMEAVALALNGKTPINGKIPVDVNKNIKEGDGLTLCKEKARKNNK